MSIKTFSLPDFTDVVKNIMKNNPVLGIPGTDEINANSSFREVLDITSLDIAELIAAIQEKYHVNMEWVNTGNMDSIKDLYNAFLKSISIMRLSKIATPEKQR